MSVKTSEELLSLLNEKFKDDTSDDVLNLLEDVADTFADLKKNNNEDWKKKYEDNDREWRQRYKERFNNPVNTGDAVIEPETPPEPPKKLPFEDLFKEG